MGAKSEALARQVETKAQEAAATLGTLSSEDWTKKTEAEGWTVGVTAHHLAGALEAVAGMVMGVVSGQSFGNLTRGMLDEMNAMHAREHAHCTREETLALLEKGAATAAGTVRGLRDDQLAQRATVFTDAPPMTAEQVIVGGMITHIDEHFGSIRRTVGR